MTGRVSREAWAAMVARVTALRSTCPRRKVGAVLLNARGHILATGYNGAAAGRPHCIDSPCPGAELPSGEGLDKCVAIHAEQNALLQCRDVYEIDTLVCTTAPCMTCTKLLLNTSCRHIIYLEEYSHPEAAALWTGVDRTRTWERRPEELHAVVRTNISGGRCWYENPRLPNRDFDVMP